MRVYAWLLGTLLTTASTYAAEIAVRSAGLSRAATALRAAADPTAGTPIWYGGMLRPITIETYSYPRPLLTLRTLDRSSGNTPCARSRQLVRHAIAID